MQNLIDFFKSVWWEFTLFEKHTLDYLLILILDSLFDSLDSLIVYAIILTWFCIERRMAEKEGCVARRVFLFCFFIVFTAVSNLLTISTATHTRIFQNFKEALKRWSKKCWLFKDYFVSFAGNQLHSGTLIILDVINFPNIQKNKTLRVTQISINSNFWKCSINIALTPYTIKSVKNIFWSFKTKQQQFSFELNILGGKKRVHWR